MYPIYDQVGKARLADWHAQAQRDALARAARRARRGQRAPSVARRLLSGQLQNWWDTLGTPVGSTVEPHVCSTPSIPSAELDSIGR
jgi:hypothetical protein